MQADSLNQQGQFESKPKVVKGRTKYAAEAEEEEEYERIPFQNLMYDKRVVRGNTYARVAGPSQIDQEISQMKSQTFKNRSNIQQEISGDQPAQQISQQESTDDGENTKRVNTDEFVETLTDKPPNYEKDTQTDFKIEVPIVRQYMEQKKGLDKETQIWDTDLFDFDYEAEPILQALLGKTLDISRMEVRQEQELLKMKQEQQKYQELKNQELAEIKRLELKEKKL